MRSSFGRLSRILDRDFNAKDWPQSWKYVVNNIKHVQWFFCRNPLYVFKDLIWWVRYRTTNRFHVLKIGSLKPGWWDADTRILHASFALLEDYVEREKPFKIVAWNEDDRSREFSNEIHDLYLWWKRHKALEDTDTTEEEGDRYQQETENLVRLIKIREVLWT